MQEALKNMKGVTLAHMTCTAMKVASLKVQL